MVNIRRQRLKAIRAGVPVELANRADSQEILIELMNTSKQDIAKIMEASDGIGERPGTED